MGEVPGGEKGADPSGTGNGGQTVPPPGGRAPTGAGARWANRRWLFSRANRRRLYEILERDSAQDRTAEQVNRVLILLIVLNTLAALLETVPSLLLHDRPEFRLFEMASLVVFAVEYMVRVWVAPENPRYRGLSAAKARRRYVRSLPAIVDLIAWLPFAVAFLTSGLDLRALAILRVLRFAKLARYSPGMQSLLDVLRSERQSLLACFWLVAAAVLVSASAMYIAERGAQPDTFSSIPAAMWWALATITTVGYGDVVPITMPGRIIAGFTMLAGVITLALPVGIIATAFAETIKRRDFVITWGMVARVPLFADLDAAAIGEIHRLLSSHTAEPGEILERRGEPARSMYFIASGEVDLEFDDGPVVLGEGQFFGELALLNHTRRAATARARRRSMLLILSADDLDMVMRRRPEIGRRIRAMAHEKYGPRPLQSSGDIAASEVAGKAE
ncbi:cyclic nucleotide-gated ion channel/potassium channel family protein [Ancylobacter sp. 6x-1]|uniref:Cyclic nucleotide-gated ion channel/potassium channel family protein n=1 Tax=Ancylobacter crimeensis TaxID=2579147 RepID=A0ABT0DFW3_9HYPH|nr:cyclic nucleotide-gated ion channel [Ancylobacter crimeensis]MCK0198845.1 cyclic nucleotide-gated ion channel/potassium channel family protein [Ancylobacter crimeensis]